MKVISIVIISWLSFAGLAQQNLDKKRPHETWGSEKQTKQPSKLLPMSLLRSAKVISDEAGFISRQVNLSTTGDNVINDAANEPSIAVNPNNPQQITIGWRQFDSIRSDFRQAGVAYSNDGGMTWINNGPIEPGVFRSDPVLAANADGTFFYQSLEVKDNNGEPGIQSDDFFQVDQWQSDDGGQTWKNKINAYGGDKSWIAIDQSDGASRGNIYAAWNVAGNPHFPNTFNYSVDNGMSFSLPEQISNKPVFGTVAVGFDGEVYVAGGDGDVDQLSEIKLLRSNNPTSQMFPDFEQVTAVDLGGPISSGDVNPFGLLGQVWVAADKSNRHTRGNVYFFSSIDPLGRDRLDVNFARSINGGMSFQPYKRINQDTDPRNRQWFGTMAVAPNGRIDLIWLDTRGFERATGLPLSSRLFYSYSYDGGITFSENMPISQPFKNFIGYPVQRKMGDYIDMVADNKGAHIAYTATFTGGQDVYYLYAKPAAFEENPYFPSHEMDGTWFNSEVPRQGVISKTLVPDIDNPTSKVINFDAVFTEDLAGNPTWFILQNIQPVADDFIEFAIMYPTGDLSSAGVSVRPIGLATKSRIYDEQGELKKNIVEYEFNMTADVMEKVMNMTGSSQVFDADFYTNSPFYQTHKKISLTPIIAAEKARNIHCNLHNLALINPVEKSEGRVPVAFNSGAQTVMFMADFTYKKTVDEAGNVSLVTDANGLASPTWRVMNTTSGDVMNAESIINEVFLPIGGNGFFNKTESDPGIISVGTEKLTQTAELEFTAEGSNGSIEKLIPVAFNSYCGDTRE